MQTVARSGRETPRGTFQCLAGRESWRHHNWEIARELLVTLSSLIMWFKHPRFKSLICQTGSVRSECRSSTMFIKSTLARFEHSISSPARKAIIGSREQKSKINLFLDYCIDIVIFVKTFSHSLLR